MTREKKKVKSVAGQKFVAIKSEKRDSADKAEYKARKQSNLAKKKRIKSREEKLRQSQAEGVQIKDEAPGKRPNRLKNDPKVVAERSLQLLDNAFTEAENASGQATSPADK